MKHGHLGCDERQGHVVISVIKRIVMSNGVSGRRSQRDIVLLVGLVVLQVAPPPFTFL